jgi:hypothetical protein
MRKLLIVLAAFAFVVGSTIPAIATDWSFYGKAAMFTYMLDQSKEVTGNVDDSDLVWTVMNSSNRFGFVAKADDIGGTLEFGINSHYATDANRAHIRLANGYWNFGAGTLVVGQDYAPASFFPSATIYNDCSMVLHGAVYTQRVPQIKLKWAGLQVALVEPNKGAVLATEQDTSIPKIEASYDLKAGPVGLHIFGGMNSYDDVAIVGTTETASSIDSTLFGVGFKFATGPFYVNGDVWLATNPGNYGVLQDNGVTTATLTGTTVNDVDSMVYAAILGYKVSDMITIEAGYGVISNERDVAGVKTERETTTIYVQAPITLAKGVTITPEFGTIDYGDEKVTGLPDTKLGDKTYYGAKWAIVF